MRASSRIVILFFAGVNWIAPAFPAQNAIDRAHSTMTVRVFKAGVFSAFGHDHEIAAPISGGNVDASTGSVEVRVKAPDLQVRDPKSSEKERSEIQNTMLGAEVLDAQRYPDIAFRAKAAEPATDHSWKLRGDLTLHGQTHPVEVAVQESGGHYRGSARLRQTEFGIKPVKIAGGTLRVKDEVEVEFDIQLEAKP